MSRRAPLHRRRTPGSRNTTNSPPQKIRPSARGGSKLPLVVFSILAMIFVVIIITLIGGGPEQPQPRVKITPTDVDEPIKNIEPEVVEDYINIPDAPIRNLPEGQIGQWAKSVVYIEVGVVLKWASLEFRQKKTGTGFVISRDGKILTNEHVISNNEDIIVAFYDGQRRIARLIESDKSLDIALLEVDLPVGVPLLQLSDDRNVRIGRKIYVMGFPLASDLGDEMTLTDGLISSIRHSSEMPIWYQISAPVNPGNSGGPLIDERTGDVLGVVTAKISSAEGIAMARPITLIMNDFLKANYAIR